MQIIRDVICLQKYSNGSSIAIILGNGQTMSNQRIINIWMQIIRDVICIWNYSNGPSIAIIFGIISLIYGLIS